MIKETITINNLIYYDNTEDKFIETKENITIEVNKDNKIRDKYIDIGIENIEVYYYKDTSLEVDDFTDNIEVYLKYTKNSSVYIIKLPYDNNIKVYTYPENIETDDIIYVKDNYINIIIETGKEIEPIKYILKNVFVSNDKINKIKYIEDFNIELALFYNKLLINKLETGIYKMY